MSCSYGPGRYDPAYEQQGHDYPIGFVRWTEQRNFQAVLHALATGALCTDPLISHRFVIEQASVAYELLSSAESSLGILLRYPETADCEQRVVRLPAASVSLDPSQPLISVIGSGNYASRMLIPAFAKAGARFHTLASSSGVGPVHVGRKFGFLHASTDIPGLLGNASANSVVIATRHDSHALLVQQALTAGKHVFVEKPLCLTSEELVAIEAAHTGQQLLMVGFNRRFAPLLIDLQQHLRRLNGPKAFVYTCNVGTIPSDHWTQDPALGGGRLLGEACHFVDLLRHLADSPIEDLQLLAAADSKPCPDTFSMQLRFARWLHRHRALPRMAARPSPRSASKCSPPARCCVSTITANSRPGVSQFKALAVSFHKQGSASVLRCLHEGYSSWESSTDTCIGVV